MHKIAWDGYLFSQPDSAFYFAQLEYMLAKEKGLKNQMALAMITQGISFHIRSNYPAAIEHYNRSLKIYKESKNKKGIAKTLNNMGLIYKETGNYPKAMDYYNRSLTIKEEMGNKKGMAATLGNMAKIYDVQGNTQKALEYYIQIMKIYKDLNDQHSIAIIFNNMGLLYEGNGDLAKAMDYYNRSLAINKKTGDKKSMAKTLNNIGIIYIGQGDYPKAMEQYTISLKIKEEMGDKKGMAHSLNKMAEAYFDQEEYNLALDCYNRSLNVHKQIGNEMGIASTLYNIGMIYKEQGHINKAMEHYTQSLKINEEIQYKAGIAKSLIGIGGIYYIKKDFPQALKYFMRSLNINKELMDKKNTANSLIEIGTIYHHQGNSAKAMTTVLKALKLAKEAGAVIKIKDASIVLFEIYKTTGNHKKALEMHELYLVMRDSILNEKNTRALLQQEYKYKYEKEKVLDNAIHQKQQALAKAKHREEMAVAEEKEKRQELFSYGTIAILAMVLIFSSIIYSRFKKTKRQKGIIEQKNRYISGSINYARRIQEASLTSKEYLDSILKEYFIYYQPKDIVSGDFYWAHKINKDQIMVAVCDCTGHGVPGAFMSMITTSLLNEIIIEKGIISVNEVLEKLSIQIIKALKQDRGKIEALDGLDMTLVLLDNKQKSLQFASAGQSLYIERKGKVIRVKGDPYPIGFFFGRKKPFTTKTIDMQNGDTLYMTSDGFVEQFGGKDEKMFGFDKFNKLITSCKDQPMDQQKKSFYRSFNNWKGGDMQIDDVCVFGIRI